MLHDATVGGLLGSAVMQKLNSHVDVIPQNCATPEQCVKHCCFGCVTGGKQDTATAFVAPAAATGATHLS